MKTVSVRSWFFIHLQSLLVGGLVDSSSLSSDTQILSITSKVGNQVVLPCSWKSQLGEVASSACYIQWTNPIDTVFEQRGAQKWQAEEFNGRVEVPADKLGSGDCSLTVSDVQIGDTGIYDSFMVVDGVKSKKTRFFIQRVKLFVSDYKSSQSHGPGEDLVLDLHTNHSVRVIFQRRNSSEWSDLWMRGDANTERLEKHLLKEQLTIKKLRSSDQGLYKVLDEQGLSVNTMALSVEGTSSSLQVHQEPQSQVLAGDGAENRYSALLILSLLVAAFQISHI